jgi:hypothetical protein
VFLLINSCFFKKIIVPLGKINMKNLIIIDIDTEREQVVKINKPIDFIMPTTPDEAKKMITDDISCTLEALCTLIHVCEQNNYGNKKDLVNTCIKYLNDLSNQNK